MPTYARLGFVSLFAFVCAASSIGCEGDAKSEQPKLAQISESCAQAEQCEGGLTCAFSACHAECATSRDCETRGGGLCVASDKSGRVCQIPSDRNCERSSDCSGVQVCAADKTCRDSCVDDKQCAGGDVCKSTVCAGASEQIGGAGGAAAVACLTPKDCKEDEICLNAVCAPR